MLLEIKRRTVPHLKALTHDIGHTSGYGRRSSTFEKCYTVLKSIIILHKRAKRLRSLRGKIRMIFIRGLVSNLICLYGNYTSVKMWPISVQFSQKLLVPENQDENWYWLCQTHRTYADRPLKFDLPIRSAMPWTPFSMLKEACMFISVLRLCGWCGPTEPVSRISTSFSGLFMSVDIGTVPLFWSAEVLVSVFSCKFCISLFDFSFLSSFIWRRGEWMMVFIRLLEFSSVWF